MAGKTACLAFSKETPFFLWYSVFSTQVTTRTAKRTACANQATDDIALMPDDDHECSIPRSLRCSHYVLKQRDAFKVHKGLRKIARNAIQPASRNLQQG